MRLVLLAVLLTLAPAWAAAAATAAPLSPALGERIDGRAWRGHAGMWIAPAGDVNGDGLADVLVGTSESHREGQLWNAYVVFGRRRAPGAVLRLDKLGSAGLRITTRQAPGFRTGAGAGDVNGDGIDDLVLGFGAGSTGTAVVIDGRRGARGTIDADHLGGRGFVIRGPSGGDRGAAIAGAGDLDRDGHADLLIAQPDFVPPGGQFGTGRVLVVFGSSSTRTLHTGSLGSRGAQIIGPGPFVSTLGLGDTRLYGVGFGEALAATGGRIAIGAPYLGGREGGAYVVDPPARGATVDLRGPRGTWCRIAGSGGQAQAFSLAPYPGGGLLVGEYAGGDATSFSHGPSAAFLVRSCPPGADVALDTLDGTGSVLTDTTPGDRAGQSVAAVGSDVLVGAPLADPKGVSGAGSAFLVGPAALGATVDLRADSRARFDGLARFDTAGWSVAGLGDVNGDGRPDLAVAAPRTDVLSDQSGSVYVIYAHQGATP